MNARSASLLVAALFSTALSVAAQPRPGDVLWIYAPRGIDGSPALGADGTVYIGAGNYLCAVTNSGGVASNKWVFNLQTAGCSPATGGDGAIYIAGENLYAVGSDGTQRWSYPGGIWGPPAIAADNTVYVAGTPSLHAVTPTGVRRWVTPSIGGPSGEPVVGASGLICIPSFNVDSVFGISPAGIGIWQAPIPQPAQSPAIGKDGTIYLGAADGLHAFSPAGNSLWVNAGAGSSLSSPSPAVGKDGTIYLGSAWSFEILGYGFRLLAVTPAGATAWEWKTNLYSRGPMRPSAPAIDAAGTIYLAAYNSLYSFSPSRNLRWEFNGVHVSITSPTIGPDGTIYATFGSRLYAFYGTNALADSSWPMYRQNPRHTGKVEKPSLQKPQKRSDANFQFELHAQIDQPYTIEASTNFNTWTSLTSFVATTVPMDVFDLEATNYPARFYRARSDSPPAAKHFGR